GGGGVVDVGGRDLEGHDLSGGPEGIADEHGGGAREHRRRRVATPLGQEAVAGVGSAEEVAPYEECRTVAVREDRQRPDRTKGAERSIERAAAQRRPARAVPLRDVARRHSARGG